MTGAPINRGNLDANTHTGKSPCEDEGRYRGDTSQGVPKFAKKPPESRQKALNRFFLTAFRKKQPCLDLDFRFLQTLRQ